MGALLETASQPTFQVVYDGGTSPVGNGAGRSLTTMTGGAVVFTNTAANNNDVFQVTKNPAGAQSGKGFAVTMGTTTTDGGLVVTHNGATAGAGAVAIRIAGAATAAILEMSNGGPDAAAKRSAANEGRIVYDSATQTFMSSKNAGAFESFITTATLTLQGAYNGGAGVVVTAANPATIANAAGVTSNLLGLTDATTAVNANYGITYARAPVPAGAFTGGAISISSTPGNAVQNESGVLLKIVQSSGALATDTTTLASFASTPGATGAVKGVIVTMGANTSTAGYAATFTSNGTAGTGTTTNAIANINGTAVLTAGAELTGLSINLTGFTNNQKLCGTLVVTSASTIADSATTVAAGTINVLGTGVQQIYSQMTVSRVVDWMVANTQGTIATIRYPAAVVLTATALKGLVIDLSTNVTAATNDPAINGLEIQIPATDAANAAGQAAIYVNSLATAARALDIAAANTSGTVAVILSNANLAGATTLLSLSATGTPGAQAVIGAKFTIPATTRADTALEGAIVISSTATKMRMIDCAIRNTDQPNGIWVMRFGGATTVLASLVGLLIDFDTNATLNNQNVYAATYNIGAGAGSSSGVVQILYKGTAGTTNGIIRVYGLPALTGAVIGTYMDLSGGTGAQSLTGFRTDLAATTRADTALEGAIVISSTATRMRMIDCAVANTGAATGLWVLRYGTGTTLSAAVTGQLIDLVTNVTHGGQVIVGLQVTVPTGAAAGSASYTVGTGQGSAIPHFLGPTDQALLLKSGVPAAGSVGRGIILTATAGTVNGAAGTAGGLYRFDPGAGGTATTGNAGNAGSYTINPAPGGAASGVAGVGGNGSLFLWTGGDGGASTNAAGNNAGAGGSFTVTTGGGAVSTGLTGGAGGAIAFTTGGGGNGVTGGVAGSFSVTLGNAGTGGNPNGATFVIKLGTLGGGAGTAGYFQVLASDGTTNLFSATNAGVLKLGDTGAVVNFGQAGTANGVTNVPLLPAFTPGVVAAVGTGWLSIQIAGATRYIPVWT